MFDKIDLKKSINSNCIRTNERICLMTEIELLIDFHITLLKSRKTNNYYKLRKKDLVNSYNNYFSYEFYVAQKII